MSKIESVQNKMEVIGKFSVIGAYGALVVSVIPIIGLAFLTV